MRLPGRWGRWRNGSRGAADEIRSGPRSPPQSNGRVAGTDVVATEAGSGTRVYRLVQMPGRAAPWCRCPGLPPSCLPESSHMLSPFRCRPARLRNRQSHLPSRKPLGTGAFRYDSRPDAARCRDGWARCAVGAGSGSGHLARCCDRLGHGNNERTAHFSDCGPRSATSRTAAATAGATPASNTLGTM